jgi:hypothetical protein
MAVETNYVVRRAVDRPVYVAIYHAVDLAVFGTVVRALDWAVNNAVERTVLRAVDRTVDDDTNHPGLQDFLINAKVEV